MQEGPVYDVIIAGGGPAGSTLAAMLVRHTKLTVALYEQDYFPREHIGESLILSAITAMSRSGVLPKVLASDCYVGPKAGGYFAWSKDNPPFATVFEYPKYKETGRFSWSIHVNRSEFDTILLNHAREVGANVKEGVAVESVQRLPPSAEHPEGITRATLTDGTTAFGRMFVDASGRVTSITGVKKTFLSNYKNVAVWNHFVGGKEASTPPGDWNVYRGMKTAIPNVKGENWSPIGNFAFEDGWVWYIPVPKTVMGKRTRTHSIGIVTNPDVLKDPKKRYTDLNIFLPKIREIPILKDLVAEAQPVSDKVLTATNYSMISDRLCSYEDRWILLGDAGFFVDPLFSTGVALAMFGAAAAAFLIESTLDPSLPAGIKKDLWYDYQNRNHSLAMTLSAFIDQWYNEISRNNPQSTYWKQQANVPAKSVHYKTFSALLNLDLLNFLIYDHTVEKSRWSDFLEREEGSTVTLVADREGRTPQDDATLSLVPGVGIRDSALLGQLSGKTPRDEYWADPLAHASELEGIPPHRPCKRFYFADGSRDMNVVSIDEVDGGVALYKALSNGGVRFSKLASTMSTAQSQLLGKLLRAGMISSKA